MTERRKERVIFLEGDRLYLRPIEEGDVARCRRWINDPEIRQFVQPRFPTSARDEAAWFERVSSPGPRPSDVSLAIVLKDGDRHIGNIGLHQIDWVNRKGTTGMLIGEKDCWSKGYGFEAKELLLEYAFEGLQLHRIGSGAISTNPRSIACLKKSGYREEGCSREAFYRDGRWVDHVNLGLLASEWRARRAKA